MYCDKEDCIECAIKEFAKESNFQLEINVKPLTDILLKVLNLMIELPKEHPALLENDSYGKIYRMLYEEELIKAFESIKKNNLEKFIEKILIVSNITYMILGKVISEKSIHKLDINVVMKEMAFKRKNTNPYLKRDCLELWKYEKKKNPKLKKIEFANKYIKENNLEVTERVVSEKWLSPENIYHVKTPSKASGGKKKTT